MDGIFVYLSSHFNDQEGRWGSGCCMFLIFCLFICINFPVRFVLCFCYFDLATNYYYYYCHIVSLFFLEYS